MALYDPNYCGESQSRAVAKFLGRKERIENLVDDVARDSHARVIDLKEDMRSCFCSRRHTRVVLVDREILGRHGKRASRGHRVTGIDREIEQDLMELGRIALDRPEGFRKVRPNRDRFVSTVLCLCGPCCF